jgi:hypothetical protein
MQRAGSLLRALPHSLGGSHALGGLLPAAQRYASSASIRSATPAWDAVLGAAGRPHKQEAHGAGGHKVTGNTGSALQVGRAAAPGPLAPRRRRSPTSSQLGTGREDGPAGPVPRRVLSAEIKASGSAVEALLATAATLPTMNLRNKSTALHTIASKVGWGCTCRGEDGAGGGEGVGGKGHLVR